ncbi:MAG: hypothetical protein CBARDMAM_6675 [uncultured Caballeronia sp.]|nr:MAG: hypothetical protein CBARDMAM_6675 [uncultured Caballeronia sp.]
MSMPVQIDDKLYERRLMRRQNTDQLPARLNFRRRLDVRRWTTRICRRRHCRVADLNGQAARTLHTVCATWLPLMSFTVCQTGRFARQYKKLNDNGAADVDAAVAVVAADPAVGERKRGDLADLLV